MADLVALFDNAATQLRQVQRHDFDTTGEYLEGTTSPPDSINPPYFYLALGPATLDVPSAPAEPGMDIVEFSIVLLASRVNENAGYAAINLYLSTSGPFSVREALLSDRKLGGTCDYVRFNGWQPPGEYLVGGTPYIGVPIDASAACRPDRIQRRQ